MDAIPPDICDVTNDIIAKYNSFRGDDLCVMIARAVANERERCAKIAENLFDAPMPKAAGLTVAAAIRSQPPLPTLVEDDKGE